MENIITNIINVNDFTNLLQENNSIVIIKFGAEWCRPCKLTNEIVNDWYYKLLNSTTIKVVYVDVDVSFELFTFLKKKKMVQAIPTILAYYKNNNTHIFDDGIVGSNKIHIDEFFERCLQKYNREFVKS